MESAAGGTSHRLYPGLATEWLLSRNANKDMGCFLRDVSTPDTFAGFIIAVMSRHVQSIVGDRANHPLSRSLTHAGCGAERRPGSSSAIRAIEDPERRSTPHPA